MVTSDMSSGIPRKCGIYGIRNKITDKYYIGSSKDIEQRWKKHKYDLEAGRHHSFKLQRAYDEYGKDAFEFFIVKKIDSLELLEVAERAFIELHESCKDGYNVQNGLKTTATFKITRIKSGLFGDKNYHILELDFLNETPPQ